MSTEYEKNELASDEKIGSINRLYNDSITNVTNNVELLHRGSVAK